ncbi:MAG TPA: DUF2807 domain-containing protein [Bacteroidetes bacterium]|nr:DUF2807 domain-containing protein [Bacteroidota bacterium]
MKSINFIWVILIGVSLIQTSCITSLFDTAGKFTTIERNADSIIGIKMYDRVNVEIIQDTVNKLFITGPENYLSRVTTSFEMGSLTIEDNNSYGWYTGYDIELTVTVHVTRLKSIYYEGVGNIFSANTLVTDSLKIRSEKSAGDINLHINASYIYCYFNQSAVDAKMFGNATRAHLQINGTGFIRCHDLLTNYCWVHNQGSGDIFANASSSISGIIEGAGNVFYTGNPTNSSFAIQGRGTGEFIEY